MSDKSTTPESPVDPIVQRLAALAQEEQQTIMALDQIELTLSKLQQQKQLLNNQLVGIQRTKIELNNLQTTYQQMNTKTS